MYTFTKHVSSNISVFIETAAVYSVTAGMFCVIVGTILEKI